MRKKSHSESGSAGGAKASVRTDWWSGRQEADVDEVLRLESARDHIRSIKNLVIEKKIKTG